MENNGLILALFHFSQTDGETMLFVDSCQKALALQAWGVQRGPRWLTV